jgi:arylsulfatase
VDQQVASSYGGTRNGLVIHWPKGIQAKGEVRSQWHHVIDIAPTILDAAGVPEPTSVNGTVQTPIEGVSMRYTFADAKAASRHTTQYFEIFGNRAIYHDGWLAGTVHRAAWEFQPRTTLDKDVWELYDTRSDFSLASDLAAKNSAKLEEVKSLFTSEAAKNRALPLDDRTLERMNAALVDRPDLMAGRDSLIVHQGMTGMMENVFINVKNRSLAITAEVEVASGIANGVLLCQAGRFGGWSLYVKDGRPAYTYNWLGMEQYTITATDALAPGKSTVRFEFAYDGGGLAKGGTATLLVNGKNVGSGRIEKTQPGAFSGDEGADVGEDEGTAVAAAYEVPFKFNGKIDKITIELKDAKPGDKAASGGAQKDANSKKGASD